MIASWYLSVKQRALLRNRAPRNKAFCLTKSERDLFRFGLRFIKSRYDSELQEVRVIPISTIEGKSQIIKSSEGDIVLFDYEEANAITFLLIREFGRFPPIHFYNEFLIRASEQLLLNGENSAALRVSQLPNIRFSELAERQGNSPRFRSNFDLAALPAAEFCTKFVPLTLLFHELGHIIFDRSKNVFALKSFVRRAFQAGNATESIMGQNFTVPDIVLKIGSNNDIIGQNIEGTKFARIWKAREDAFVEEAFCDCISLINCCEIAIDDGVSADILVAVFLKIFLFSEANNRVKAAASAVPHSKSEGNVCFTISTTGFRIYCLSQFIRSVQAGEFVIPNPTREYLRTISSETIGSIDGYDNVSDSLMSNQLYQMTRAAIARGVCKPFENDLSLSLEKAFVKLERDRAAEDKNGPTNIGEKFIRSQMRLLNSPHQMPDNLFAIEDTYDKKLDNLPFFRGFCCAVRDLAATIYAPDAFAKRFNINLDASNVGSSLELLELARSSRAVARERNIELVPDLTSWTV